MNVFEAVDVISLIRNGAYDDLGLTVGEALQKRSPVRDPFSPFNLDLTTDTLLLKHLSCLIDSIQQD